MKKILLTGCFFCMAYLSKANNIQLSNISTTVSGSNVIIRFDLSWENSWRVASTDNRDGAWIFFKFRDYTGEWKPIRFSGNNITIAAGYTLQVSDNAGVDGVGAFIYRSNLGSGFVNLTNVQAGIEVLPGTFDVKGFALEMVYIPAGSFYIGDGSGVAGNSMQDGSGPGAYLVTGNGNTVLLGNAAGQLNGFMQGTLPTHLGNFPTGYSAFWMMKYELSQGAFRDFLNTLTYVQQVSILTTAVPPTSSPGTCITGSDGIQSFIRGRIEIITAGVAPYTPAVFGCDMDNDDIYNETTDGEWLAMGFVSWPDITAYLDWAGLRPYTDLEYEKACRGPLPPVPGEFAWGTPDVSLIPYTVVNAGQANEQVTNMSSTEGNALLSVNSGSPVLKSLRNGIFATPLSNRVSAGASYYGVMELTGNMLEYGVSSRNVAGRSYGGKLGNGVLNANGEADENFWPGINGNNLETVANTTYGGVTGVTDNAGHDPKGGSASVGTLGAKVSYRSQGAIMGGNKEATAAIRGVRDAN